MYIEYKREMNCYKSWINKIMLEKGYWIYKLHELLMVLSYKNIESQEIIVLDQEFRQKLLTEENCYMNSINALLIILLLIWYWKSVKDGLSVIRN